MPNGANAFEYPWTGRKNHSRI